MTAFLQYVVAGLAIGSVFALVSLGWVTVMKASDVLNLAQGEFAMVAGLTASYLVVQHGWPMALGLPAAIAVGAALGAAMDLLVIRRIRGSKGVGALVATLGLAIALREVARMVFGAEGRALPPLVDGDALQIGGVSISRQIVVIWVVLALVVVLMAATLGHTVYGKAMSACAEDPLGASIVGVRPSRMRTIAFATAGALGALAGVLITPLQGMSWDSGTLLGISGFIAAALGGLGSYYAAVAGALTLGVIQGLSAGYLPSSFTSVIAFVLLILVLIARPQGLFHRSPSTTSTPTPTPTTEMAEVRGERR